MCITKNKWTQISSKQQNMFANFFQPSKKNNNSNSASNNSINTDSIDKNMINSNSIDQSDQLEVEYGDNVNENKDINKRSSNGIDISNSVSSSSSTVLTELREFRAEMKESSEKQAKQISMLQQQMLQMDKMIKRSNDNQTTHNNSNHNRTSIRNVFHNVSQQQEINKEIIRINSILDSCTSIEDVIKHADWLTNRVITIIDDNNNDNNNEISNQIRFNCTVCLGCDMCKLNQCNKKGLNHNRGIEYNRVSSKFSNFKKTLKHHNKLQTHQKGIGHKFGFNNKNVRILQNQIHIVLEICLWAKPDIEYERQIASHSRTGSEMGNTNHSRMQVPKIKQRLCNKLGLNMRCVLGVTVEY